MNYKLIDRINKQEHEMNESEIRKFFKEELGFEDAEKMSIEEISEILHSQFYSLILK